MIEISGLADLLRDFDELRERMGNGVSGAISNEGAERNRDQRAAQGDEDGPSTGILIYLAALVQSLLGLKVSCIEGICRCFNPGRGIFLQIENLQVGNSGITGIDFFALLK